MFQSSGPPKCQRCCPPASGIVCLCPRSEVFNASTYHIHTRCRIKLVQKVKLPGLLGNVPWKWSLGQALPLVKVSKDIFSIAQVRIRNRSVQSLSSSCRNHPDLCHPSRTRTWKCAHIFNGHIFQTNASNYAAAVPLCACAAFLPLLFFLFWLLWLAHTLGVRYILIWLVYLLCCLDLFNGTSCVAYIYAYSFFMYLILGQNISVVLHYVASHGLKLELIVIKAKAAGFPRVIITAKNYMSIFYSIEKWF